MEKLGVFPVPNNVVNHGRHTVRSTLPGCFSPRRKKHSPHKKTFSPHEKTFSPQEKTFSLQEETFSATSKIIFQARMR